MSTIKVTNIEHGSTANGGIQLDNAGHVTVDGQQMPTDGALSNRNLVQNGAMTVSQRSTSKSGLTSGNNYVLDRWRTYIQDIGTYTISQASDAPAGFKYSHKIQCTTADASPAAADDMSFYCVYEGQDLQQLKKGTSSAESVTLSFWIKSNKTATGQVNIRDQDNSRLISSTYTVSASNTWEYKTITFPGDTSGVLDSDNAGSLSIQWYLDSGSNFTSGSMNSTWAADSVDKRNVNNFGLASSTDNYWQITGIQLEVGEKATPFEHRSYSDEIIRCARYFQTSFEAGQAPAHGLSKCIYQDIRPYASSSVTGIDTNYLVEMRATPTITIFTSNNATSSTNGHISYFDGSWKNAAISLSGTTTTKRLGLGGTLTSGTTLVQYNYTAEAEL